MIGGYLNNAAAAELVAAGRDTLTIAKVSEELVGIGKEAKEKPVMYFAEIKQGIVINGSRGDQICSLFPEGDLKGQRVRIEVGRLKGSEQIIFCGVE